MDWIITVVLGLVALMPWVFCYFLWKDKGVLWKRTDVLDDMWSSLLSGFHLKVQDSEKASQALIKGLEESIFGHLATFSAKYNALNTGITNLDSWVAGNADAITKLNSTIPKLVTGSQLRNLAKCHDSLNNKVKDTVSILFEVLDSLGMTAIQANGIWEIVDKTEAPEPEEVLVESEDSPEPENTDKPIGKVIIIKGGIPVCGDGSPDIQAMAEIVNKAVTMIPRIRSYEESRNLGKEIANDASA